MKRLIGLTAAVAVMASVAGAAVPQFHDLGTSSVSGSISTDGTYVGSSIIDPTALFNGNPVTYRFPAYWTADPNGGSAPVRTNIQSGWGAGYIGGIDKAPGGTLWTSLNAGSTTYSANNFVGRAGNPTNQTTSGLYDHNNASSNVNVGGNNSAAASLDGTFVWIAGLWSTGSSSKGNDGMIWKWDGTQASRTPFAHPTLTGKVTLRSISNVGYAIGDDRGGLSEVGASGATRAVYWTPDTPNTLQPIPGFSGHAGVTRAQGFGVSSDGQYFSGLMYEPLISTSFAFRWKMGDATAQKMTVVPNVVSSTIAVAYDIATDGTAVGNSFVDDSNKKYGVANNHDTGTIWFAGETAGTRVIDVLRVLGLFDPSKVRTIGRTYGIAELGNGQYALHGDGTFWTSPTTWETRGWYAVVPEPATVGFLALGSLLVLRRRR